MNNKQIALKSILDQYAACTLTIDEAESKLAAVLSSESPVVSGEPTHVANKSFGFVDVSTELFMSICQERPNQNTEVVKVTKDAVPATAVFSGCEMCPDKRTVRVYFSGAECRQYTPQFTAETFPRTIFIETEQHLSQSQMDGIRQEFGSLMGNNYNFAILECGLKLSDGQAFRPAQLNVECGSISINVNRSCFGVISVDGVPLKVRSADIHLEVGELPSVKLEIVP